MKDKYTSPEADVIVCLFSLEVLGTSDVEKPGGSVDPIEEIEQ